ncbi:MAG: YceI family protein [Cardiobacteriaceae bacterium]|nr:YceI family protein [Cardiobacteriaceae bacterium]
MKKFGLMAFALAAGIAQAATYNIDPHHTNVRFHIDHFGTSTNTGGIYALEGKVEFDAEKKEGSVSVEIPVKFNSGNAHFDNHLASADIFNAEKFPTIKFVSKQFNFEGDKVKSVDGDLTILDQTHPVTLNATKFNCYDSPMLKTQVCGGDFEVQLDRSQWGVHYLTDVGMAKDVRVTVQIEAAKQ